MTQFIIGFCYSLILVVLLLIWGGVMLVNDTLQSILVELEWNKKLGRDQ